MYTNLYTEVHEVMYWSGIDTSAQGASQTVGPWVDVKQMHRLAAVLEAGTLTGTLAFILQGAEDDVGTNLEALETVNLTAADDDTLHFIEIRGEQIKAAAGVPYFRYVRIVLTHSNANVFCATLLGIVPRNAPVSTALIDSVNVV